MALIGRWFPEGYRFFTNFYHGHEPYTRGHNPIVYGNDKEGKIFVHDSHFYTDMIVVTKKEYERFNIDAKSFY